LVFAFKRIIVEKIEILKEEKETLLQKLEENQKKQEREMMSNINSFQNN
jgi:hypothetical protein